MNASVIQGLHGRPGGSRPDPARPPAPVTADFARALATSTEELRFSSHAQTRMRSRNIALTPEMMGSLRKAVDDAAVKGSRDSLIMLKNLAFIVHVPNRTVVTAMDGERVRDNIFTNIDSAVIAG